MTWMCHLVKFALELRGAGTHNGMKSVIQQLGSQEFMRLRLGIGPKPEFMDSKDFVLQNFSSTEQDVLPTMVSDMAAAFIQYMDEPVDMIMNRLNPYDLLWS